MGIEGFAKFIVWLRKHYPHVLREYITKLVREG